MSGLSVSVHFDDREESRHQQLLAVWRLRRGLERGSTAGAAAAVPSRLVAVILAELARALREVIAALDRRRPRVEQPGEAAIARDAAALRAKAVSRLDEIEPG